MPNLKDNLKQWRDSARIDWFSQFIKAWIPFNAWMTDAFGDLSDRELLDSVKNGGNVVYNRIIPILTWKQRQTQSAHGAWHDMTPDAEKFRINIEQLHGLLQSCVVEGRKGRVSFETVDIGHNAHIDEQRNKLKRNFRVRRDHPTKDHVTLEISATKTRPGFAFTQPKHDRPTLEDAPKFQALSAEYRAIFLAMHATVAPRKNYQRSSPA